MIITFVETVQQERHALNFISLLGIIISMLVYQDPIATQLKHIVLHAHPDLNAHQPQLYQLHAQKENIQPVAGQVANNAL